MEDKECLLKHKFYYLKTDYIIKIGYLEHELFNLDLKLGAAKRKIELAQDAINQNTPINIGLIEEEVKREFGEFLKVQYNKDKEIKLAGYFSTIDRLTEEEYQDLKKYYRGIARLLLPDVYAKVNEVQKSLWEKANLAYENGEVQFLKIIYKLAKDEIAGVKRLEEYTAEELDSKINDFEIRIKNDLKDINTLLDNFPFNKEMLLKDETKISEMQKELKMNIKDGSAILNVLEEHFLMMLDDTKFTS